MGLFTSINTAATGLTAQRVRLGVISNIIANIDTARTPQGGPFVRSRVVFAPRVSQPYWRSPFLPACLDNGIGHGVRIVAIQKDHAANPKLVWDPTHPDAIKSGPMKGYVEMPNVNIVNEMVDMIDASRAYEANVAVIDGSKSMFLKSLQI